MALSQHHVLIVGAGAAGTSAATELRRLGFRGQVTILNGEEVAPYNRTAVNSTLLQPDADLATVGQGFPDDEATSLVTGVGARSVDLSRRSLRLGDGTEIGYDTLLVASGARARELPADVHEAARSSVTTLRSEADAGRIRDALRAARAAGRPGRVVIAGAGLLGSETADALTRMGHRVHLVDPQASPLERLVGRDVAGWVDEQHRSRLAGVWQDAVVRVEPGRDGGVKAWFRREPPVHADMVVVALGVVPEVGWLSGTGLGSVDGVLTDDRMRVVGAAGVYAAGDVARPGGGPKGEHWGHALSQGTHAARAIAHDLDLAEDPGALVGSTSFSTRLYDNPITVLGRFREERDPIDLAGEPAGELHVAATTAAAGALTGAVVRGPLKVANRLRPLIAAQAPLEDAVAVLAELEAQQQRRRAS